MPQMRLKLSGSQSQLASFSTMVKRISPSPYHTFVIQYAWLSAFSLTIDPMAWRCPSKLMGDKMFMLKQCSIELVSYTTN